jgi:hypothetical protein
MKCILVVSGFLQTRFVMRLVEDLAEQFDLSIVPGDNTMDCLSHARTLLTLECEPVALVLRTDSNSRDEWLRECAELENLMAAAPQVAPWKVVVFFPFLELLFFQYPEALKRLLKFDQLPSIGTITSPHELKHVVEQVLPNSAEFRIEKLIASLTNEDLHAMRSDPQIRDLREFIQEVCEADSVPDAAEAMP